jgi:hypothetical protein
MNGQPDEHDEPVSAAPEDWVYGGIRVLKGKRVHAWIDQSGRELLYAHKRGGTWAIGSYYTAQVSRHDGSTRLHNEPTYTGEQADTTCAAACGPPTPPHERSWPGSPRNATTPAGTPSTTPSSRY